MSEVITETNISKDELYNQYNWFQQLFLPATQTACDEFFSPFFSLKLISVSKNVNILFQGGDYFVTKIRIDKQHDAFFRCSADAVNMILEKILGPVKKFDLSSITELEAKIVSSFNDYTYSAISKFLLAPPPKNQKRKDFDMIHLTFFIKEKESQNSEKIIISLPKVLLNPQFIQTQNAKFDVSDFNASLIDVNIKVGKTKFLLKELKNLEKDDIVIFEDSDIHSMEVFYKDYRKHVKVTPNPGLITSINNDNGGHNMEENALSQNLWDNIQVEMGAEFEKVKITLGELKNIEQGLVVDISSVYDNKISLKVENKTIAKGELVIINDRYGVRVDEVFASEKDKAEKITQTTETSEPEILTEETKTEENLDDEFNYSDFELDDQDI